MFKKTSQCNMSKLNGFDMAGYFVMLIFFVHYTLLAQGISTECCGNCLSDCKDYLDIGHTKSGVYHVTPNGMRSGIDVYCDMLMDGGGWMVFQRRTDGSVNFYRDWDDYEIGFGNVSQEHWLGLITLRRIVKEGEYELRVDLQDWENETRYAKYKKFSIGDSASNYTLEVLGYSGNAGNGMGSQNGQMFSTKDKENDPDEVKHCAERHESAWWFNKCGQASLNGVYFSSNGSEDVRGICWREWLRNETRTFYTLKKTEMKIRSV